ncbi:MAG: GGDEF domain-containing protein [Gallionellaceae bacterium]|jgi:diguanylate cyclase (GGDEF)-like protein|nr:GGDEF domain-containing protein [Gallionellaceae bacterium]
MKALKRSFIRNIFNELPREEMMWLLFPHKHMSLLSTRRATMIISRVRMIAALFAVFTVLFIVPDMILLPSPACWKLSIGRIIAGVAFTGLALSFHGSNRMRDAYLALAALFAIPTAFFIFSYLLLSGAYLNGIAATITATYAFLPIVMVAGLSMFPLTALEGAIYAAPVLIAEVASALLQVDTLNLTSLISTSWLVVIIAVVATLSSMSQLGFVISLVRTAIRDTLTGCYSRMSGTELLEIQFIIATRSNAPLALAFIDLDNFKSVNDGFGHEAGDLVLSTAAERTRAALRTGDMLVRWGGEEFILIMPNSYCNDAIIAIERLRASGFGTRPDNKPVTASIGIAERLEDKTNDWKTLVEIADQRMYAAKQSGKDRAVSSCTRVPQPAQV